jgi:hypothetical protein
MTLQIRKRSSFAIARLSAERTDLTPCTTSNVVVDGGASVLWYVPGSGEIYDFLNFRVGGLQ